MSIFSRNTTDPLINNSYAVSTPILSNSGMTNEDLEDAYFQSINRSDPFVGSKQDFANSLKNRLQWNQINELQPINTKPVNQGPFSPYYATNSSDLDIEREELTKNQLDSNYLNRRKEWNSLEPINVDYSKQAINALNVLKKPAQTDLTIDKIQSQSDVSTKSGKVKDFFNNNSQAISAGLSTAGAVGDMVLNQSYKGNQGAYVSGAFGKNQMYDDIANTNTTIAATDFNDAYQQQRGITNQLNAQKTKELSGGQIGGMAGTGAAKGAAMGMQVAGPWGGLIGGVVGAGVGTLKGVSANNQIRDSNLAIKQKQQEANNYMQNAMSSIRQRNANLNKQSAYNMYAYNNSYGGNLFANGGALQDPYGINYFGEGRSHENNRFGGIPVSIAEDGKPNLVEEGEVLYNDYVFSKRINITDSIRRRFNFDSDVKTFADAAKEIQERGKDRPNDSVTERTIKAHMQILQSKQEEIKQKKDQREQEKMLAQMSEQEKQMLEQQQMEQQANAYEQQMAAEQQAQMAQQQQIPQEGMPQEQMPMQEQQQPMYAEGGKLKGGTDDIDAHRFAQPVTSDKTKLSTDHTLGASRKELIKKYIKNIEDDKNLSDEQKKERIQTLFRDINNYQDTHKDISSRFNDLESRDEIKALQAAWSKFAGSNDSVIGTNFDVDEGGITKDRYNEWVNDGVLGNQTRIGRTWGTKDYGFSDDELKEINELAGKYGFNYGLNDNGYYKFNPVEEPSSGSATETPAEEPKLTPEYDWRYRPNWIPGAIDLGMLAQSFAPADYSRARSIENTPIREVQYTPNGQYIKPYIIDPRQQYMMNYANAQATNRAIQNNAGGNGANAVAAMLANNAAANQAAAQIGFQADAQNAENINKAIAFNNAVDAQNAQGFLQASEANQRADAQRGEFNYYGKMLRENIDKQRGQAISNSWGAVADDFNNYYNDRYNRGMIAGLAESGYFGEMSPESLLRKNIGFRLKGYRDENGNLIEPKTV